MELIVTVILFALLILGIKKKVVLPTLMFGVSVLGLLYLTIANGSVLGEGTHGNAFVDIFEFIATYITGVIGGIVLLILVVIAYLDVMKKIQATSMLAALLSSPISKVKKPYLLATLVIILGIIFRVPITLAPVAAALLIATLFPVLIRGKVSLPTAATAVTLLTPLTWGPADSTNFAALSIMGLQETNMTTWFAQMQVPMVGIFAVIMILTFVITAKIFDKKEEISNLIEEKEALIAADLDVPKVYAILPFLPVILLFVFSPLLVKSISFSITGVVLVSLVITALVHIIAKKKTNAIADVAGAFFSGLGDSLKSIGLLITFAMLFATTLNMLGGMQIIADVIGTLSVPSIFLVIFIVAFSAIMTMIVGSFFGALTMSAPVAMSIAASAGINPLFVCYMVVMACGAGGVCSPVNPVIAVVSQECKIDILKLIKRVSLPVWTGLIGATIIGYFLFGSI